MTPQPVTSADGALRGEIAGEGPEVVLLHGFALDIRSWDAVFADLSRDHHVLRYDLRGFGRSALPDAPYDHLADLHAMIRAAGMSNPVVTGLSLGANIALRHGLESLPRPPGVVLCSPGLAGHEWDAPRPPDAAREIAAREGADAACRFWLAHEIFAPLRQAGLGAELDRMGTDYSGFHWRQVDPQRPAPAPIPMLAGGDVPALILSGDLDVAGYRAIAARLADSLPDAQMIRLPDAGHMLAMERPDVTAGAIRAFVNALATEGSQA